MTSDTSGFMHRYYDWADFERFVEELYQEEGNVVVERDVTETDRYGAKRQTDVKITRQTKFHQFITLVECKRWKEPVSRDRIDVLAASIEALGASNGAIFTTTGYEEGALSYAEGRGIDLFVIRDLTPEEWGQPGRFIQFYLHTVAGEFRHIRMPDAQAVLLIEEVPDRLRLDIRLDEKMARDPDLDLFSVRTGARGPNLIGILGDVHGMILRAFSESIGVLSDGSDHVLELQAACELDMSGTEFRQIRLPEAATQMNSIRFEIVAHITQANIEIDRGRELDFAVMVEKFITEKRIIAHRKRDSADIQFKVQDPTGAVNRQGDETLENGSIFRVYCQPWIGLGGKSPDTKSVAGNLIKAYLTVLDGKPEIDLRSETLPEN